jgi:cob(I)alamin adenosyltransferase
MTIKRGHSITTRKGDRGTTGTLGGAVLSKAHPRIEACGTVDELVSALGLARAAAGRGALGRALLDMQKTLFTLAAEISAGTHAPSCLKPLDAVAVRKLDRQRMTREKALAPPRGFVVPGETWCGAHLDLARTAARRCERAVVALTERGEFCNPQALIWLNRLSDLLWLMARQAEGRPRPLVEA